MTAAALQAEACAVCGRPLTDALSIAAAVGPDCRTTYGYYPDLLASDVRAEADRLLHDISRDAVEGTALRDALFRLHELGFVQLAQRIERRVHRRIVSGMAAPPPQEAQPEVRTLVSLPFTLTEGQERARSAVQQLMSTRGFGICVIAGYAGTGKSTLLRVLGDEYGSRGKPVCVAPTGKAALRIREAAGLEASTIHRWIYAPKEDPATGIVRFMPRQLQEITLPLSKLVLLDEASMVGPDVWKDVYQVCKQLEVKLVCVGDAFQLPPVQAPNAAPFSILSPEFARHHGAARIELTEVLRQAQDSPTIRASMKLRAGGGISALNELRPISIDRFGIVATETHRAGGVTICHRNVTRATINAGLRMMLGINDEQPQPGEPLVVLKNTYEAGLVNGESIDFAGWDIVPDGLERVYDRYKNTDEVTRFGSTRVGIDEVKVVLSLEELHGRLAAGPKAIEIAASKWARLNGVLAGDSPAPLLHVNFGYGWTAHKCVAPTTLVETDKGLQQIKDITRRGTIATGVGPKQYRHKVVNARTRMVRITTTDGYSVDVTRDHGMFAWRNAAYERVLAARLTPGDTLRLSLRVQLADKEVPALPPLLAPADARTAAHKAPRRMTLELAELLGLLVADGTVTPRGVIRLAKRHRDVTDRFALLCQRVFGFATTHTDQYAGTRAFCEEKHSAQIARWLLQLGGVGAANKFVPDVVLRSSLELQAAFLRGLFEDGTVNVKAGKIDHIEWSNCSNSVAHTVQTMLLRFGIVAARKSVKTQTRLYIYGANAKHFGSCIGFVSAFKQDRLALPCGRETRYSAPFSQAELKLLWPRLSAAQRSNAWARGCLSRASLHALAAAVGTGGGEERLLLQNKLAWHHSKIAKIEALPPGPSMCVAVPGAGRFLQNGFDGSNSQGSEWNYVLVAIEPSIRLNEEDGRRWTYTAITRSKLATAVCIGRI